MAATTTGLGFTPEEEKMFLDELREIARERKDLKKNEFLTELLNDMLQAGKKAEEALQAEMAMQSQKEPMFSSWLEEEYYFMEQERLYREMLADKKELAYVTAIISKSESVQSAFTPVKEKLVQVEPSAPKKTKKSLKWFDVNGSPVVSQRLFDTTEPVCVM